MKTVKANIWDLPGVICIPTNLGWSKDGRNIMGAGLARQAALLYPDLPSLYGRFCLDCSMGKDCGPYAPHIFQFTGHNRWLICVATKALDKEQPWMSWNQKSSLSLVRESVTKLVDHCKNFLGPVLVVPFGCGCGGLSEDDVLPLMDEHLGGQTLIDSSPKFTLVKR